MKHICVLTGSRAEYGLLKPVIRSIGHHASLELSLLVTGMHLLPEFGDTYKEILKDGFKITEKIPILNGETEALEMPIAIGKGIEKFARSLFRLIPDVLLVLGDRYESLAGAIAAAYLNICVAHIHGGDSARAGLDESARHAISKFAHVHFPATDTSAERLRKMGEDPWRIRVVGAPALDTILNTPLLTQDELTSKYAVSFDKPVIILVQHALTTEPKKAGWQMAESLAAIRSIDCLCIVIHPNVDLGGRDIINEIRKLDHLHDIRSFKSLPQVDYLSFLKHARLLVGNSSSGIIESSSFNLPVINVGNRQEGRERSNNVLDVPHDRMAIKEAINRAFTDHGFIEKVRSCRNPYGDGKTGPQIAGYLNDIYFSKNWIQKKLCY
jgi:GDP/UDP-N,N'-diacetylbacillosamine 2-epimerase (hydrolysing)